MPFSYVFFPPDGARCVLTPDSGTAVVGTPTTDSQGRQGQVCIVPDSTPSGHGATYEHTVAGMQPVRFRGFLLVYPDTQSARLQVDDTTSLLFPVPPETPPPPTTGGDPQTIINAVYATGQFDLSLHDGCGQFVEKCLADLMQQASMAWGHILKTPGQNQYQGHAVDALMLLAGPGNGIFDIIQSSVSPDAKPQYIRQGDPDPDLWYQPTDATGFSLVARPTKFVHLTGLPHPTA